MRALPAGAVSFCIASARHATALSLRGIILPSTATKPPRHHDAIRVPATCVLTDMSTAGHRRRKCTGEEKCEVEVTLHRGPRFLRRLLLKKWPPSAATTESQHRRQLRVWWDVLSRQQRLNGMEEDGQKVAISYAAVFPLLGRLFAQASTLFQVGVLLGPAPTALAAGVTAYWAWQVMSSTPQKLLMIPRVLGVCPAVAEGVCTVQPVLWCYVLVYCAALYHIFSADALSWSVGGITIAVYRTVCTIHLTFYTRSGTHTTPVDLLPT